MATLTSVPKAISRGMPFIDDLSFVTFTCFIVVLLLFTLFTDVVLCIVVIRANNQSVGFPTYIEALNYFWIAVHMLLFSDLFYTYLRFYRPTKRTGDAPRIRGSEFLQPRCWRCLSRVLKTSLAPRSFLLFLALSLPLNALLFYDGLGSPAYDLPDTELATYNLTELLSEEFWPSGSGLSVNLNNGSITGLQSVNVTPPVITNKRCYRTDSNEFQILARLQHHDLANQDYPKQAYCETFIGLMMASSCGVSCDRSMGWMSDEDRWDESFQFTLRLFSSLAGIMSDQAHGGQNFWFLKDMTDVFDMFMMTFADVDQLHEGRPLLAGHRVRSVFGYKTNYHTVVWVWVWVGVAVVFMRAFAAIEVVPFVWLLQRAGCRASPDDLRTPVDAALSLFFVETPYLILRWIAWYHYGVPVSVMAVKNVLGILEDLHLLGVMHGFAGVHSKPRGLQLCLRRRSGRDVAEEDADSGTPHLP